MNLALVAAVLSVTGSGKIVTQERAVAPFHALSVCAGIRAQVHRGAATKVVVRSDDNTIDLIETTVKDGRLEVHPKRDGSFINVTMELDVTVAALDGLEASGGVSLRVKGHPKSNLSTSGAAHASFED